MTKVLSLLLSIFLFSISYSQTITIGTQVWMSRNLDVSNFRNGDPIPQAKSDGEWVAYWEAGEPAWCYYNNDPSNGQKHGKLYNWFAVSDSRGLAPIGWHVASLEEWEVLRDNLGGEMYAGSKLKSKSGWAEDYNGTNSSGFNALPSGWRSAGVDGYSDGEFANQGKVAIWWTSTIDYIRYSWAFAISYEERATHIGSNNKGKGQSVRCVKD